MANDLMKKVGELLDLAGLDKEVVKSVTEKLIEENVKLVASEAEAKEENAKANEGEEENAGANEGEGDSDQGDQVETEEAVEEAACPIKKEEEDDEDTEKAPVDPKINVGGICVEDYEEAMSVLLGLVKEAFEKTQTLVEDFEALKVEHAKLLASVISESYEEGEGISEAETILSDFQALKEEYASLLAALIMETAEDVEETEEVAEAESKDEVKDSNKAEEKNAEEHEEAVKAGAEDEEAKQDEEKGEEGDAQTEEEKANKTANEMRQNMKKEKGYYDKAHNISCGVEESSDEETADKIAEGVSEITEEAIVEEAPVKKGRKAYSAFSSINESEEVKSERKAFTLFPDLK